jgi:NADH-quinone oxidoreductase subunit N
MNAIIISALLGVVMMFAGIWVKNISSFKTIASVLLVVLLAANILDVNSYSIFSVNTRGMLAFTRFGHIFNTIAIVSTLVFVLLSGREMEKIGSGKNVADYYALIFFVLCGITILSNYSSLLMLFLGVEIMSIPLYILTGSDKRNLRSNEAALKYFLMGSFSTGLMLMGIALIYGAAGSFQLESIRSVMNSGGVSFLEIAGMLFLMVSMSFKVSVAPFHFWTPDVYDGAPSVFTSFMSTIVKAAGFIAFLNLFAFRIQNSAPAVDWRLLFSILIVCTLLAGNITAMFQQSVKRMLAYSSIAQAGFMLFALFSLNEIAKEGLLLYAASYCLATIGIFAVLMKLKDYTFEGYKGLAKAQPVLAFTTTVFLLSLAGIPLTAGFFAKYYMLASAVKTGAYLWLVIVAVLFAAVSVAYYFRVIQAMYFREGETVTEPISGRFKFGLIALAVVIIVLGILPQLLLNFLYF